MGEHLVRPAEGAGKRPMRDHRNWTESALNGRVTQSGFRRTYRMAEKTEVGTMKGAGDGRSLMWTRLLAAAIAAALLSALIPGTASPYNQDRMDKDIAIMENVINTAMVESEYVYIFNTRDNVRGLYIPEFGTVFTVQVQLISNLARPYLSYWMQGAGVPEIAPFLMMQGMDKEKLEKLLEKLDITVNGKKVDLEKYFLDSDLYDIDVNEKDNTITLKKKKELAEERQKVRREVRRELAEKNLEQYKEELVGLVADYGGTIRQLEDNQWVMVAAYLNASRSLDWEEEPGKVIVKAKKADLDLYDSGKIDYDELKSRMDIEVR